VPSKGPEWRQLRLANDVEVSGNDLLGIALHEEIGVDLTTSGDVPEDGLAVILVLDDGRHAVGVSEPDAEEFVLLLGSLNEGEWVDTVGLLETSAVVIRRLLTVGPHSPSALGQLELPVPFAKAKDVLRRQLEVHLEELVHDVASLVNGRDKSLAGVGATYLEAEWIHVQLEVGHI